MRLTAFVMPVLITMMNAAVQMLAQRREDFPIYFVCEITDSPPPRKGHQESMYALNINQSSPFL